MKLVILLGAVLSSFNVLAAWGTNSHQREAGGTQFSVQDGQSNNLGQFAGVVQTRDSSGLYRSAYLVVSPQGYMMPVFVNGEVAVVEPAYFQSNDCSGVAFVQVSSNQPVFTGLPGAVFQGTPPGSLVYIRVSSSPLQMTANSYIENKNIAACITGKVTSVFYKLEANDTRITGHSGSDIQGPLSLLSVDQARAKMQANRRAALATGSAAAAMDDIDYQEECSPGCLAEDINNDVCDIACWAAECSYDGGDCESLPQSELDEMLRSICSPGCFPEDINDGFCDVLCNVELCNFDGDDCIN